VARRALGSTLFFLGRFADASREVNEGIAIDDAIGAMDDHRSDLLLHTERAGVVCRQYSAWTDWILGFPDRALKTMQVTLALSQRLSHPFSDAYALNYAAVLHTGAGSSPPRDGAPKRPSMSQTHIPCRNCSLSEQCSVALLWPA
jgi:hypothetical protein